MLNLMDDRFDSWKEIAAYLNRDLRTARRWERDRGLPVHRVPGTEHGGVFAYRSEIDAWLLKLSEASQTVGEGATDAETVQVSNPLPENARNAAMNLVSSRSALGGGARWQITKILLTKRNPAIVIGALLFGLILILQLRPIQDSKAAGSAEPIEIRAVSPILPRQDQTIFIKGTGFGLHTRYSNLDSPFIAIRDKTGGWAAGRIIPQNWDKVTLNVQTWEDTQIAVSGFSGAYGSEGWELRAGDKVEIVVWNPQTGRGPALYHLTVSAQPK
jgi:hypothetical protein